MLSKKCIHCSPNSLLKDYLISKAISTSVHAVSDWFAFWAVAAGLNSWALWICRHWIPELPFLPPAWTVWFSGLSGPQGLQWPAGVCFTGPSCDDRRNSATDFCTRRTPWGAREWKGAGPAMKEHMMPICSHTLTWVLRDQHMLHGIIWPGY